MHSAKANTRKMTMGTDLGDKRTVPIDTHSQKDIYMSEIENSIIEEKKQEEGGDAPACDDLRMTTSNKNDDR